MAKRKAAVNDIIYELDNEDIVISSDDEVKESKINRLEVVNSTNATSIIEDNSVESISEVIDLDTASDSVSECAAATMKHNGGKTEIDNNIGNSQKATSSQETADEVDSVKKTTADGSNTTIFNEDIVIDSPGNSDLGVEGCENRTPLVTVRFRDSKMASNYKEQVKAFMLNLIKLHEGDSIGVDSETDIELDIWPEDLIDTEACEDTVQKEESSLFFVDTEPCTDRPNIIPRYSQVSYTINCDCFSNITYLPTNLHNLNIYYAYMYTYTPFE